MTSYPIHEVFHTFQGEGMHLGKPAFFIRTFGCPVHCPWCDSAGTWHPDWIPKDVRRATAHELAAMVPINVKLVVVTGGEPAIHNLEGLVEAMHDEEIAVHLETSGAFPIQGNVDWVTLSPKKWKHPVPQAIDVADEFKFIIEEPADIEFYWNLIQRPHYVELRPIWLHPEWSHHLDPVVLHAISEAVKEGAGRYRAGWQLHKCYGVDFLDKGTRPLVPLGGDVSKGF
jgi:7-carboxy-7-deazaguanine synthase